MLFDRAVPVVSQYGDALADKIIVDITNPFNPSGHRAGRPSRHLHRADWSPRPPPQAPMSSRRSTPSSATSWPRVGPLDVFIAGDDAQAKASVSAFIESLGLRPQDTGDLSMAHWLEGAGLLSVGLARHGVGDLNFSLGVNLG